MMNGYGMAYGGIWMGAMAILAKAALGPVEIRDAHM